MISVTFNILLSAAASIIQIIIKIFLKCLDYKQQIGQEHHSGSSVAIQKATSMNSKYTVSLGSALFCALVLPIGFTSVNATRHIRLFFLIPYNVTLLSVIFPLLIIVGNSNLKKDLVKILSSPFKIYLKCFTSNTIHPIV